MKLRQCVVLLAMLVILFVPKVYADTIAEYTIEEGSYDSGTQTYNVYLNTTEYLSYGTFGLRYDAAITPKFTLNEDLFSKSLEFPNNGQCYMVFQWYLKNDAAQSRGKLLLGTIKIDNVIIDSEKLIPVGWHTKTLCQLDWYDTPESNENKFMDNTDGVCLNDEVYKKYDDGSEFYQGLDLEDVDDQKWVDIGFRFDSGYDLPERKGKTISGVVHSYNPKNKVTAQLCYSDGRVVESMEAYMTGTYPDGRVDNMYSFTVDIEPGTYTLEIKKDVHLTYIMVIKVSDAGKEIAVDDITLYCGDINADERIKLYDRTELLQRLNQQSGEEPLVWDLNGDGKVTVFDLSIMKLYYNKSYGEVASYVEKT